MSGQDLLRFSGQTACYSVAGLVVGGTSTKIQIAATNGAGVDFCIDGIAYHKTDADDITMTALANQAASTSCLYMVTLTSDGTLAVSKGNEITTTDIGVVGGTLQWPVIPDDVCPIGGFKMSIDSTASGWTCGTTALDAANVVGSDATYYDFLGGIPLAPQVS